jgi:hypothetical protein
VKLRRITPENKVEEIDRIRQDSMITPSADRKFASVAEGNISSGPVRLYDFKEHTLSKLADLDCFHFEMACARGAKYFARPHSNGCDLLDDKGGRLGNLEGKPVLCAAFHPKNDHLFVMRHGEIAIEEYDILGKKISNKYPLDKPLVIKADVVIRDILNLQPVGPDTVMANFRTHIQVLQRAYASGRIKISDNGEHLFVVIPTGVYTYPVDAVATPEADPKPRPKIKVIDPME